MLFSTPFTVLLYALIFTARNVDVVSAADQLSAQDLAARYGLTTSTTLPFPSATQTSSDAQKQIVSNWSLNKGRIQDGADNLAFVTDPFPNNSPTGIPTIANTSGGPVLEVTYPKGSFSHDTGGSQLYSLWNTSDGSSFGSMMVSYEVAFNWDFDFVKGGKLPGLRGGLDSSGCSGGNEATGQDCFSSRVMWRANAAGEVYAYIPSPNNLCSAKSIICNSDFGISISRGSFGFVRGQWNRVTMLVQLNNPPDVANGQILLYYNDLPAIAQQNLQIRSSDSLVANGFYFSTFFGGSDASWATPQTVNSYFRNIHLWGGSAPSNLTGEQVRNLASHSASCNLLVTTFAVLSSAFAVYL
ncbi:polysaccharide lyase family 14 protein [Crucibulum laeve]|uniref:Polysaccharide lyase family 14 protein n=1 Tax=Crucibulum laeve TaxID=68775 RepID=A0A5C3MK05_9AGAR|nr:polysaccharide lyase family 14 protein [Crucibulum laeve]